MKATIIGTGSLGSFLSWFLSENGYNLCLIDGDIVLEKNLLTSFFMESDIGKYKVCAIRDRIESNFNVDVSSYKAMYKDNTPMVEYSNIVIDCRDFIYTKSKTVDVKAYIGNRNLFIDARENIKYSKRIETSYDLFITKNEIREAAIILSNMIVNKSIDNIINRKILHTVQLSSYDESIYEEPEIIDNFCFSDNKLIEKYPNLEKVTKTALIDNKENNLNVFVVGSSETGISKIVKSGELTSPNDFVDMINKLVNKTDHYPCENFSIFNKYIGGKIIIEILPNIGSA